jgi:hypothetical protein
MRRRILSILASASLLTAGLVGIQAVQPTEAEAASFICGSYVASVVTNNYCRSARSVVKGTGGTTYGDWVGKGKRSINAMCHRITYSYGYQYYL